MHIHFWWQGKQKAHTYDCKQQFFFTVRPNKANCFITNKETLNNSLMRPKLYTSVNWVHFIMYM